MNFYKLRISWVFQPGWVTDQYKNRSYVLEFNQDMNFVPTENRVSFNLLRIPDENCIQRAELEERAKYLRKQGKTYRVIKEELKKDGYNISKSTIGKILKGFKG